MDRIGGLGIFVAIVGIVMVVWGWTQRSKANAMVGATGAWPTAPGTITATETLRGGSTQYATFSPVVRYDYQVGGRSYAGDRLRPGYVKVGSRSAAERMLQPYPVGASVPVRYDPADAASSLLELKTSSAPLMTAVVGGILILFGGALAAAS